MFFFIRLYANFHVLVLYNLCIDISLVAAGCSGFWSTYNVLLLILVEENPLIINPIDDTKNLILLISPLINSTAKVRNIRFGGL